MRRTSAKSGSGYQDGSTDSKRGDETGSNAPLMRRKSLLDHLEATMSGGESKTFIYRLTVVGYHEGMPEDIMKFKDKLVTDINTTSYDEPATGFLVVYPNHFLHLIEGSEDTLNKYLQTCDNEFDNSESEDAPESDAADAGDQKSLSKVQMKILSYVRVFTRSTDKWLPLLRSEFGTCDILSIVPGFRNRLFEFVKKVWILSTVLPIFTQPEEVAPMQNMLEFQDPEDQLLVQEAAKDLKLDLDEELDKDKYFPTLKMLEYFMKPKQRLPPLRTPKEHMQYYWNLPSIIMESETVWPIPSRLASYD